MFNLLMFNVDWSSGRVTVPIERMFEHTETSISSKFRNRSGDLLLDRLSEVPCLCCQEGTSDEVARVGHITRARITGKRLSLEINFDPVVLPLQNSMLFAKRHELEMDDFEFSRNHWAIKDLDLYRFLIKNAYPRRQRPSVFQISEYESIEPTLASAMMPFDASFNEVYASIQEAAASAGLRCRRADDIWENAKIIEDVVSLIDHSRVVVCDCTGRNSNVFYEAGIAHTLGRDVILITQSESDIPFDLRHLRYVLYLNNSEGRDQLTRALTTRLQTLLGH